MVMVLGKFGEKVTDKFLIRRGFYQRMERKKRALGVFRVDEMWKT